MQADYTGPCEIRRKKAKKFLDDEEAKQDEKIETVISMIDCQSRLRNDLVSKQYTNVFSLNLKAKDLKVLLKKLDTPANKKKKNEKVTLETLVVRDSSIAPRFEVTDKEKK